MLMTQRIYFGIKGERLAIECGFPVVFGLFDGQ